MQLYLALSESILKPVLNGQKEGIQTIYIPSVGWKGNRLKFLYMVYGYVKVTLKEHYDNNKSPNQSSLFCLKVKINMRYAKTCFLLFYIW